MVQDFLQNCYIFEFYIMVVAESFSERMRSDLIIYSEFIAYTVYNPVGLMSVKPVIINSFKQRF